MAANLLVYNQIYGAIIIEKYHFTPLYLLFAPYTILVCYSIFVDDNRPGIAVLMRLPIRILFIN
jgi:hypothetical protein